MTDYILIIHLRYINQHLQELIERTSGSLKLFTYTFSELEGTAVKTFLWHHINAEPFLRGFDNIKHSFR